MQLINLITESGIYEIVEVKKLSVNMDYNDLLEEIKEAIKPKDLHYGKTKRRRKS